MEKIVSHDPLIYLTAMMFFMVIFFVVALVIIANMHKRVNDIKRAQEIEYKATSDLRNEIKNLLKLFAK